MSGQVVVTIGTDLWTVSLATSLAELSAGLSDVESIPEGTGILFDMGSDQDYIRINMDQMLFVLDIVFVNSEHGVVGVLHDVQPLEATAFDAGDGYGARYFMEVNAGELSNVEVGDNVAISGNVQPAFWAALVTAVQALATVAVVGTTAYTAVKQELKK